MDDLRELFAGIGERVKVVLSRPPGLDQPPVPQEREMVADRGLALRTQVGAELGDVAFFFGEQHQDLKPRWVGDLLQELGDATNLGRRPRRAALALLLEAPADLVEAGGISILKVQSQLGFGQLGNEVPNAKKPLSFAIAHDKFILASRQEHRNVHSIAF